MSELGVPVYSSLELITWNQENIQGLLIQDWQLIIRTINIYFKDWQHKVGKIDKAYWLKIYSLKSGKVHTYKRFINKILSIQN